MSRFLLKFAAFALIQCGIALAFFTLEPPNEYLSAIHDKEARLKATAGSPRLLLVGGSNVAFGFDSPALETEFPGYQVVNLGLMAGIGLDSMLAQAARCAQPGDVIVVAPEYDHLAAPFIGHPAIDLIRVRPSAAFDLSWGDWKLLGDSGLGYMNHVSGRVRNGLRRGTPVCYRRSAFNEHGDVVAHEHLASTWKPKRSTPRWEFRPSALQNRVDQLVRYTQAQAARGIPVVIECIPLAQTTYEVNGETVERIRAALLAEPGLRVLHPDRPANQPDTDFFDTDYHLTWAAKQRRTAELAQALATETVVAVPTAHSLRSTPNQRR